MGRLNSKVALVTGGASGLGKAIAQRLLSDGAAVVITDVQVALGEATAIEGGFAFLEHDVCDEAQWMNVSLEIERRYDRWDILVNNAGIVGPMDAATPESTRLVDWRRIFAINVEGVFLGCRSALGPMRAAGGGSIINVSSVAGLLATPNAMAYGASKATVRQMTKSVAQYCAQEALNIRCNSVHPGVVRTPLLDKAFMDLAAARGTTFDTILRDAKKRNPMGDFVLPEDVAAAVAFLASEEARFITGEQLVVDGGSVSCDTYRRNEQNYTSGASSSDPSKLLC